MIHVTKTFLPPLEEYNEILRRAWDVNWITNRGRLVLELEERLKDHLDVSNVIAMTNGTLPIQIAIKSLKLQGEIITTPFSYVATTSSIVWEQCTPVFVDIDPVHLTIDENKIEAAITKGTSAILATHVFGNPCYVEAIETIAKRHNLKVIYDAAHCFGVTYKGKSIFEYGDISTCSFHATKLFHTGEGGAIFFSDEELYNSLFYHHNFGHRGKEDFQGVGINGKMSELQAAMGLAVLPYIPALIESRKRVIDHYRKELQNFSSVKIREGTEWNYSYFPIFFEHESKLLEVLDRLNKKNIFPRRYFYPSLNKLNYVQNVSMPISDDITSRILCLPVAHDLTEQTVYNICKWIKG